MSSHISAEQNGHKSCRTLPVNETGTLFLRGSAIIFGASPNSTVINLARSTTMDGRCSGTQYSDPYGTWHTVVVQIIIKIVLKDFEIPMKHTSQLILLSRQRRNARRAECLDSENGQTF